MTMTMMIFVSSTWPPGFKAPASRPSVTAARGSCRLKSAGAWGRKIARFATPQAEKRRECEPRSPSEPAIFRRQRAEERRWRKERKRHKKNARRVAWQSLDQQPRVLCAAHLVADSIASSSALSLVESSPQARAASSAARCAR